ncbi:MAG: hydrogenase maturation protease [Isosphaeraceae bacterium]
MNWPRPIRVVAIGSPWGDDALAWEVVRQLRPQLEPRMDIELHALAGGQRLLDLLDGQGTLLLVDAAVTGMAPGTIHCFEWPEARIEALRPGSTHQLQPAEALRLAGALGLLPPRVVVFGIEIQGLDPDQGLSPSVAAAVPALVRLIVDGVESLEIDSTSAPARSSSLVR